MLVGRISQSLHAEVTFWPRAEHTSLEKKVKGGRLLSAPRPHSALSSLCLLDAWKLLEVGDAVLLTLNIP